MRKIKTQPADIWKEYGEGKSYNDNIELYSTVKTNENFYNGKQWEGVNADDLEKPCFNIIKRCINLFLAQIVSDDISVSLTPFGDNSDETAQYFRAVKTEIERCIEYSNFKSKNRLMLRNAAVDGDGCYHWFFDNNAPTGQAVSGLIECEIIDNTNIFFGNPYSAEVQKQPYILILQRKHIEDVKDEAARNGISEEEISMIRPDNDADLLNDDKSNNLVSVIVKYWRDESGFINAVKSTQNVIIRKPWKTGYKYYPVSYMSWEEVKNSYHGQSAVTERIPNQIFINKIFAMAMYYVKVMSFPKLVYDVNRLPQGISNRIGEAIAVEGNVNEAIANALDFPDMSNKVMELAEKTMQYTQEYMGASDATLGNMKPDNATAIIALQSSANAPLELIRQSFYQMVEDSVRIILELMAKHYGTREIQISSEDEQQFTASTIDFGELENYTTHFNVDVGASSYWSEIMQVQTLDSAFANGIIVNPVDYLEAMPDKYMPCKQKFIDSLRAYQNQQEAMAQPTEGMPEAMGGGDYAPTATDIPYDENLSNALSEQGISDSVIDRAISG